MDLNETDPDIYENLWTNFNNQISPLYASQMNYPSSLSQSLENLLVSLEFKDNVFGNASALQKIYLKEDQFNIMCMNAWPSETMEDGTRSGKFNGIKITVDLETFDNGDGRYF